MNDPGLGDSIQQTENQVEGKLKPQHGRGSHSQSSGRIQQHDQSHLGFIPAPLRRRKQRQSSAKRREARWADGAKSHNLYQPAMWWFFSTAFPLFCGSFGPIANLFSVCALVSSWRIEDQAGKRILDPHWLLALNACSLGFAIIANLVLLFNFARRIRYAIAQPITITLWYISAILLLIPIGLLSKNPRISSPSSSLSTPVAFSQSYYYGLISAVLYSVLSTMLFLSTLGSSSFIRAYPPSFSTLTHPQRTLMLQTTSFTFYIGIAALIFSHIEKWDYTDTLYWADYTLLTIGLGTDFPLHTTLGRMLLIPFAIGGITMIGLIVSSVRQLVLDRAKTKVLRRFLTKKREKWGDELKERHRLQMLENGGISDSEESDGRSHRIHEKWKWFRQSIRFLKKEERRIAKDIRKHVQSDRLCGRPAWHRMEFELMRFIEKSAETTEHYFALGMSFMVIMIVWTIGALIFWRAEREAQGWTYVDTFYFTYTSLLTIGYGDFYPSTSAGRPFFVVWSLISVPAMTVLISNMGDTVVTWVREGTVRVSRWTILPERKDEAVEIFTGDEEKSMHDSLKEDSSGSNLAAEIAREISVLAKDLNEKPTKKYKWDEWERWLKMLGKIDDESRRYYHQHGRDLDRDRRGADREDEKRAPVNGDLMERPKKELDQSVSTSHHLSNSTPTTDDWEWTWLGDEGPLFSRMTETEWIIDELCIRLEEVLEERIYQAKEGSARER
ncbi:hypothetical protein CPB83DRAFT_887111 [Crepidotus variabilis]|uniref:Potassium channel domain-containing protein n=1 Tax=Crepidotus variabilis TaxID=179855 RepID=A0A9P6E687_9AGAR|nr:hypothetical protein CPB83DRAFT_887111 [Crepidotus variabilis]